MQWGVILNNPWCMCRQYLPLFWVYFPSAGKGLETVLFRGQGILLFVRFSRRKKEVAQFIEAEEGCLTAKVTINEILLQNTFKINNFFRYVKHGRQPMSVNKASIIGVR